MHCRRLLQHQLNADIMSNDLLHTITKKVTTGILQNTLGQEHRISLRKLRKLPSYTKLSSSRALAPDPFLQKQPSLHQRSSQQQKPTLTFTSVSSQSKEQIGISPTQFLQHNLRSLEHKYVMLMMLSWQRIWIFNKDSLESYQIDIT